MATHQNYGNETPGSKVAMEFSERIKNKVVVITGVSPKSLGQGLAVNIAKWHPSRLILASRTSSKLEAVVSEIKKDVPDAPIDTVILDLASQVSIRKATDTIANLVDRIDILINNAAVVDSELKHTEEGIEMMFGIGHIGHFLFTNLLLPLLEVSGQVSNNGATRIVNVTSEGHRVAPVRFHDYNFEGKPAPDELPAMEGVGPKYGDGYSLWSSYGQVKSANILFSLSLTDNLETKGIRSYAVHPGAIQTDLSRSMSPEDRKILDSFVKGKWITLDQGIATILVAALDPALDKRQRSVYLSQCQIADAAPHATDPELAKKLWTLSEELTASKCSLPDAKAQRSQFSHKEFQPEMYDLQKEYYHKI